MQRATPRQTAYRELVRQAISDDDLAARLQLQRQHALGADRLRAAIEARLGRCAGPAKIGRPRKRLETALCAGFSETALAVLRVSTVGPVRTWHGLRV